MIQSVPSLGCSDQNNRRRVRRNGNQNLNYSRIVDFYVENASVFGLGLEDFGLFVVHMNQIKPVWRSSIARD
jgi:hypothetical protein